MQSLQMILHESAMRHKHLCPRQVLGARMSLLAEEVLGLELPRNDKRLLVITETDGCAVDGIIAATGCHVGGRTLRILDFGKVAAVFADTRTEETASLYRYPKLWVGLERRLFVKCARRKSLTAGSSDRRKCFLQELRRRQLFSYFCGNAFASR